MRYGYYLSVDTHKAFQSPACNCNDVLSLFLDSNDPKNLASPVVGPSDVSDVNGSSSGAPPPISILPCLTEEPDDQDPDEEEADETSFLTKKNTKA